MRLILAVLLALAPGLLQAKELTTKEEAAKDPGRSQWFKDLKQHSGTGCCDVSDCYRTQAKQLPDGSWTAILRSWDGPKWIPIPPQTVLNTKSIDGDAYLCATPGEGPHTTRDVGGATYFSKGFEGFIYCFVKPFPGY